MPTLVEGDRKAPFSMATTPWCCEEHYSIPWIAPLYLWSLPYDAECWAKWHQVPFFESLVWLDLGLNPRLPDHCRIRYIRHQINLNFETKFFTWNVFCCCVFSIIHFVPYFIISSNSSKCIRGNHGENCGIILYDDIIYLVKNQNTIMEIYALFVISS